MKNGIKKLSAALLASLILASAAGCDSTSQGTDTGVPSGTGSVTEGEKQDAAPLNLYVSPDGDDANDGSEKSPFATIDGARKAIRKLDRAEYSSVTVNVAAGEYRISGLLFSQKDGGTESCPVIYRAAGDGETVLNGGISIASDAFAKVTDPEMLARLSDDAKEHVYCVDLTALGVKASDWGDMHALGSYHTAERYDGDYVGDLSCELFENDRRMTVARYPDTEYLLTGNVISEGVGLESLKNPHVSNPRYYSEKNLESDVYEIDDALAARISSWKTLDDVWMFGFWAYDWADASSPIGSFDAEKKEISPKFVSMFGAKKDAPYYFYNVFEELDTPGEWYLDRNSGVLYLYPTNDIAETEIDLSLTSKTLLAGENVNYLTLDGFTFKGTRGDAVTLVGNNNTVQNCLVKNIAGNAIYAEGSNHLIRSNEITHTGRGGIIVSGGDSKTLTPGNNVVDNNYIHDWSEIYQTYQPAVSLYGVGNICSHNEISDSPHEAITYGGNNHIIEYNKISRVCLLSSDAGAIYSGRKWTSYGNIMRYNLIEDLGSGDYTPCGIYWDDALSGQTAYGNIFINVPGFSFHLGGGRDLTVYNNIIINDSDASVTPISYDARAIEGITSDGWFTAAQEGALLWTDLESSPWQTDVWKNAFPQMTKFSNDFSDTDNPDFVPNPAYSKVTGNLILADSDREKPTGNFSGPAQKYSEISDNFAFSTKEYTREDLFASPADGDYRLKEGSPARDSLPDFEDLPFDKIGRYTE